MRYVSTRGRSPETTSAEAIKKGIASDGGLFVPDSPVYFSIEEIASLENLPYEKKAAFILKSYLTDYDEQDLQKAAEASYGEEKFDGGAVAPLQGLDKTRSVMELWHGPTYAFKDVALQILPKLLTCSMRMSGEKRVVVILVATSGDTGKAALEGFADVEGTRIVVFYPSEGVSEVQKRQMVTQTGANVGVIGVKGNFDDVQTGVKMIFGDRLLAEHLHEKGLVFSSANSINWGRLAPQIVYYFSAYSDLCKEKKVVLGDKVNFAIPTGNFGNILAGWYAKAAGLPINKLICASNDNNVLTDFLQTGVYNSNRPFHKTSSPSMDILISSNLERLLFEITDGDSASVSKWMALLAEKGSYDVGSEIKGKIGELFYGGWTDVSTAGKTILETWKSHNYLVDPHTAVALDVHRRYVEETMDNTHTVIVSTASPFKFNSTVAEAIFGESEQVATDEFDLLDRLSTFTHTPLPKGLRKLRNMNILHKDVCKPGEMKSRTIELL